MTINRRILFFARLSSVLITSMIAFSSYASTTKVGNGDDGSDLEQLTPIKDGALWETRQQAVELLQRLNIPGVAGLGLVIPELRNTEMLMARRDVHATVEQAGSFEVSQDKVAVYARTFAEPYAATRFFPAAMKLSNEQMVALHIHEALHRALPAAVRADENKVMILTLAMTSPGATYDRVAMVANTYVQPALPIASASVTSPVEASVVKVQEVVLPAKSRGFFKYAFDYTLGEGTRDFSTLEYGTSLGGYRKVSTVAIEPYLRTRILLPLSVDPHSLLGPASLEFQARFKVDDDSLSGAFVRFNSKTLADSKSSAFIGDRDIVSIGGFYQLNDARSYLDASAYYSFPSTSVQSDEFYRQEIKYNSIISLTSHAGARFGKFFLGGIGELHASQGSESTSSGQSYYYQSSEEARFSSTQDAFRLLVAGPELGYKSSKYEFKLSYKMNLNSLESRLASFGDILDRGVGSDGVSTSFAMSL